MEDEGDLRSFYVLAKYDWVVIDNDVLAVCSSQLPLLSERLPGELLKRRTIRIDKHSMMFGVFSELLSSSQNSVTLIA